MKNILLVACLVIVSQQNILGQLLPTYTEKKFVSALDSNEFKETIPDANGFTRRYLTLNPQIFDADDNDTTFVSTSTRAVVCIEGTIKDGINNGLFTFYLIDSLDHAKRYKIWEQDIMNDQLHGQWKIFSLDGKLVSSQTFKNDSLHGLSKDFTIDGKLYREREFFNGSQNFKMREYFRNGKLGDEMSFEKGMPNGPAKKYYSNGNIMDEVTFKNGKVDGHRKYYYPSGKLWVEYYFIEGKLWNIIGNYDERGKKRNPGTLKKGNGTVILYDEDGSVREVINHKNGVEID